MSPWQQRYCAGYEVGVDLVLDRDPEPGELPSLLRRSPYEAGSAEHAGFGDALYERDRRFERRAP